MYKKIMHKLPLSILLFIGVSICNPELAKANYTYNYTGKYFTIFNVATNEPQLFHNYDYVSFSFTVSNLINTGGTLQNINNSSVLSWKISTGSTTLSSMNNNSLTMYLATTQGSTPTSWDINTSSTTNTFIYSDGGPHSLNATEDNVVVNLPYIDTALNSNNPGVWTVNYVETPAPTPIPADAYLLGSGLISLFGLKKRRS